MGSCENPTVVLVTFGDVVEDPRRIVCTLENTCWYEIEF